MTQGARAFFSYCRDDSDFALKLAGDLKAAGASVWLDQVDITPGDRWDRAVEAALTDCPCLLVILSPGSVNSTNVMDEVSFALEERKTVIPVIYRDCTVPFRLRRVQHVDLRQDYARGLQELLRTMSPEQGTVQSRPAIPKVESPKQSDVSGAEERQRAIAAARLEDERRKATEQAAGEKAQQERVAQEKAEAEPRAAQRAEQERINREKIEAEHLAAQNAAAQHAARERDQREGLERQRSEAAQSARLAQEAAAQQRQAREKAEAEQKAKATAEVSAKAELAREALKDAEAARLRAETERVPRETETRERVEAEAKAREGAGETQPKAEAAADAAQQEPRPDQLVDAPELSKPGASSKKYLALIAGLVLLGIATFLLSGSLRMRLGLAPKLQLLLQVQVQDALKHDADQSISSLREDLQKARIAFASVDRNDPSTIALADTIRVDLKGIPHARQDDLHSLVSARYSGWTLMPVTGTDYALTHSSAELAVMKRDIVERTLAVIQSRIEALGFEGRAFRQSGKGSAEDEIVVQLWGRPDDLARTKAVLLAGGRLEITPVVDGPFASQEIALSKYGGVLPPNSGLAKMVASGNETWYLLSRTPVITGRDFRSVHALPEETKTGKWEIYFTLNADGAHRFSRFTGANVGRRLAIVLNNDVHIVNTIHSQIADSGVISGLSSKQEADDLVEVLRGGEMPAGVAIVKEQ